jgi:hypothetical protein
LSHWARLKPEIADKEIVRLAMFKLTNQFDVPDEASIASALDDLRVVQVEIDQHQISRRSDASALVSAPARELANQLGHPSILAVSDSDALRRTRQHEVVETELDLLTFLNLREITRLDYRQRSTADEDAKLTWIVHIAFSRPGQACDEAASSRRGFEFSKWMIQPH